jgi:hypothetical protein
MLPTNHPAWFGTLAFAACLASSGPLFAYDTIGNGFGSKWGASPNAGTGAIVTWGFMPDGTQLDPNNFPFHSAITGTSNITALRNSVDVNYGAGAFDTAIQNAFNTWSAVANITFVGPVTDPGLPVAGTGATTPNIRIGAFQAVPNQWFRTAIGIGPPGPFFEDPFSGDVIFNVAGIGTQRPYQIAPGTEDVTPVDVFNYGDDVEGLFVHELGHAAIGLDHPRWAGENPDQRMMYVGDFTREDDPFCCQSINRNLHVDDIAAAQYVYGIRGDYNRDRKVDAADYVLWRKTKNQTITSGTGADGNVDGTVNASDYNSWRTNLGNEALLGFGEQPSMFTGSAVPEPNACLLFIAAATSLCASRAMRQNSSLGETRLQ